MKTRAYIGILVAACAIVGLIAPLSASAEEVRVDTVQAIPPGGTSCAPLQVLNIQPYIVDNALHSFDVTVNDASYVALLSTVGNTTYTFQYVSRWRNANGSVRQHIDVQTTPIGTSLPITLTLLSAKTGQPVCMSTIRFAIAGNGTSSVVEEGSSTHHTPSKPITPVKPATSTEAVSTTSTSSVVRGSFASLADICAGNGSLQLWFFLITLYLVGAAAIALREPIMPERLLSYTALLIIVPAILLLAFWAFASVCRGAAWVPGVVFIIAIASLLAALWERQAAPKMAELAPIQKKELLSGPSNTV